MNTNLSLLLGVVMSGAAPTVLDAMLPERFLAGAATCDASSFVLFGGVRGRRIASATDVRLYEEEAVALRFSAGRPGMERRSLGPGSVLDACRSSAKVLFAVRAERDAAGQESGRLYKSSDESGSWASMDAAPRDLIGVRFATEDIGFVWSSSHLYRTADGGASWTRAAVGGRVPRISPHPFVEGTGSLIMAVGRGSDLSRQDTLLRFAARQPTMDILVSG